MFLIVCKYRGDHLKFLKLIQTSRLNNIKVDANDN